MKSSMFLYALIMVSLQNVMVSIRSVLVPTGGFDRITAQIQVTSTLRKETLNKSY